MDNEANQNDGKADNEQLQEGEELNQRWTVDEDGVVSVAEDDDQPDLTDNPDADDAP